jgi:hypothetical protein
MTSRLCGMGSFWWKLRAKPLARKAPDLPAEW